MKISFLSCSESYVIDTISVDLIFGEYLFHSGSLRCITLHILHISVKSGFFCDTGISSSESVGCHLLQFSVKEPDYLINNG